MSDDRCKHAPAELTLEELLEDDAIKQAMLRSSRFTPEVGAVDEHKFRDLMAHERRRPKKIHD